MSAEVTKLAHLSVDRWVVAGGLVDDEDDDVGVPDDDVLIALNFEALRKLNAYAHAISPQSVLLDKVQAAMVQVFAPQYGQTAQQQQQELPPIVLASVIDDVAEMFSATIAGKNLYLKVDFQGNTTTQIPGQYQVKLRQVLLNLSITN